ncbi:MAG: TolC family protein, partial [Gemmataceae bacterium]
MALLRRILGTGLVCGLVGCIAPGTDRAGPPPEVELPAARDEAASSTIVPVAWQLPAPRVEEALPADPRLGEVPVEETRYSLNEVLQRTLNSDPRLRAGFETISQAEADLLTASLFPNPQLFGDIQLLPLGIRITPQRQGGPPQSDVMVTYPIDWFLFGKRAAAMMAARVGVQVSEADYAELIRERLRDASLAHYDVVESRIKLVAARAIVASARQIEEEAKKIKKPETDLQRIRLHILKTEQDLRLAHAAHVSAKARLRVFLGEIGGPEEVGALGDLPDPTSPAPPRARELFDLARQNRPDITSLELKVTQAQARVRSQNKQAYPQVAPQFGYSYQFQNIIGMRDASLWDAALTVSVPLFDRNQGNRAKAASMLNQNMHQLYASLVDLRAEIEQLVQDYLAAETNAEAVTPEDV